MILLHTYPNPNSPAQLFEEKLKNFDYSLGSEVSVLAKEAEALLLLEAEDHVLAKHPDRFAAQRAVALLSKGYPIKLIGYRLVKRSQILLVWELLVFVRIMLISSTAC